MNDAVIVSTARTGVGKAYRGALNNTEGPTMAGHVIAEAVKRARIEPGAVEDVVMGCAMQQGTMVMNVARKGAIRAGLPVTVAGTTIDRQCASGLQSIAVAAHPSSEISAAVPPLWAPLTAELASALPASAPRAWQAASCPRAAGSEWWARPCGGMLRLTGISKLALSNPV